MPISRAARGAWKLPKNWPLRPGWLDRDLGAEQIIAPFQPATILAEYDTQTTTAPNDWRTRRMTNTMNSAIDEALISDEFLRDPYPTLRQLQAEAPVYWSESVGAWIITRYDDVIVTFRDVTHFSNEGRLGRAVEYLPPEQRAHFGPFEAHYATKSLLHSDPPDHTRLRALVNKAFTPRVVEAMRPRIQAIVDELLDAAPSSGPVDLIRQLASPLPAIVIAEIVGAPSADSGRFKVWADDILAFQGVNRPPVATLERSQRGIVDLRAYLTDLIADRRKQPREDLLSYLVAA